MRGAVLFALLALAVASPASARVPAETAAGELSPIAGQFAAYSLQEQVRLADVTDGRSITFESAPVALRVNRFGRVGWIAQGEAGVFEVHRADLAGRDMLLDSGTHIRPSSFTVRRGKLRWRNGSHLE